MHHPTERIKYATAFVTLPIVDHLLQEEITQWSNKRTDQMTNFTMSGCSTTELCLTPLFNDRCTIKVHRY